MKTVGSIWFGKIGIVLGYDIVTKERKAYIGIGEGRNQIQDEIFIKEHGKSFPIKAAESLIKEEGAHL